MLSWQGLWGDPSLTKGLASIARHWTKQLSVRLIPGEAGHPGLAGSCLPTALLTIWNCHLELFLWKVVISHILFPDAWVMWFHPVEFTDE